MERGVFISEDDEANLRSLVGRDTQIIYTDEYLLEFEEECIESERFFVSLKDGNYLELSLEWDDSNDCVCSFIVTLVTESKRPANHGFISLGSVSKIYSIECYSGKSSEGVYYPQVIILLREDGKKLAFFGRDNAFRKIAFPLNLKSLDNFFNDGNFSLRLKL